MNDRIKIPPEALEGLTVTYSEGGEPYRERPLADMVDEIGPPASHSRNFGDPAYPRFYKDGVELIFSARGKDDPTRKAIETMLERIPSL